MKNQLIEILKLPADATEEQIVASISALNAETVRLRTLVPTARENEIKRLMAVCNMTRENALIVIQSREAQAKNQKPARHAIQDT